MIIITTNDANDFRDNRVSSMCIYVSKMVDLVSFLLLLSKTEVQFKWVRQKKKNKKKKIVFPPIFTLLITYIYIYTINIF